MNDSTQQTGWKKNEDSFVEKAWSRAMVFLALSVLTCMIPLLPEAPEQDGILVLSDANNASPQFQPASPAGILTRLRGLDPASFESADLPAVEPAIPSIPAQLQVLHPAMIALPAAQMRFAMEDGEIKKRVAEAKAKSRVEDLIRDAYLEKGVKSAIFRDL